MKTIISNWVDFATNGNPNTSWSPIRNDREIGEYQHIYWNISGSNPAMTKSQNIKKRMDLWDQVLMNGSVLTKNVSANFLALILSFVWIFSK